MRDCLMKFGIKIKKDKIGHDAGHQDRCCNKFYLIEEIKRCQIERDINEHL